MKYIAQTISYILHPMLMPLYILFFIFNNNTLFAYIPWGVKLYCYLVTVFALLIMPVISLPLFKHFRLIRSYELNDKQERVYPILVAVAFAFVTNKPFVFCSHDWSMKTVIPEFTKFIATRISSGVLETLILFVSVDTLGGNGNIWKLVTQVLVIVVNYVGSKLLVFRKK